MNKQEIQNEINKTKEHLANLKKMLAGCEYERWKPENKETYWYVNSRCESACAHFCSTFNVDTDRYQNFNCFQSREQAEAEAEKILVRRMLEDIARRLNKGREIDWSDDIQVKHFIYVEKQELYSTTCCTLKVQGTVYCLDKSFKDIAIKEIGEERLKNYLRGE